MIEGIITIFALMMIMPLITDLMDRVFPTSGNNTNPTATDTSNWTPETFQAATDYQAEVNENTALQAQLAEQQREQMEDQNLVLGFTAGGAALFAWTGPGMLIGAGLGFAAGSLLAAWL